MVREEKTKAAFELIEIYCELIAARLPMIESQKYVNPLNLESFWHLSFIHMLEFKFSGILLCISSVTWFFVSASFNIVYFMIGS